MILPYTSGIYAIRHKESGVAYIGRCMEFQAAWAQHRSKMKTGKHPNLPMQRAYDDEGLEAFAFEILEECEPEDLCRRADYYMLQEDMLFNTNGPEGASKAGRAKPAPYQSQTMRAPIPPPQPTPYGPLAPNGPWAQSNLPTPVILNGIEYRFPSDERRAQAAAQQK